MVQFCSVWCSLEHISLGQGSVEQCSPVQWSCSAVHCSNCSVVTSPHLSSALLSQPSEQGAMREMVGWARPCVALFFIHAGKGDIQSFLTLHKYGETFQIKVNKLEAFQQLVGNRANIIIFVGQQQVARKTRHGKPVLKDPLNSDFTVL